MTSNPSIAINLRRIREEKGLTLRELAKKADLSYSTISQYETGRRTPSFEAVESIRIALEVPLSDLVCPVSAATTDQDVIDRHYTKGEQDMVRSYRDLDDWGKGSVDNVLAREHARCNQARVLAQQYHLDVVAAHGEGATLSEQEEALSKLLAAHPEFGD